MTGILVLGATNIPWQLDPAVRRRFEKRIYISLPDASARSQMFRLNIGNTPCNLSPGDFKQLGDKTVGFSGSDIAVVVRDALMEPVRKVQMATHFKKIVAPDRSDASKTRVYLTPCSPGDPEAFEKTWMDVSGDELMEPTLTVADFVRAVGQSKKSVNDDDVEQYTKWTEEFGQEG